MVLRDARKGSNRPFGCTSGGQNAVVIRAVIGEAGTSGAATVTDPCPANDALGRDAAAMVGLSGRSVPRPA
jgi:hypothetical protein